MSVSETPKKKKKILLVEDNEDSIYIIQFFLNRLGYEVIIAENGEIGIKKSLEHQPDLILMDMMMPVMDGYQASKSIKANEKTKMIPIIALTAHVSEEDRARTLDHGCDDYLPKPIEFDQLGALIKRWIGFD